MNSLIVDDEPGARSHLTRLLRQFPDVVVAGEAADGLQAIEAIDRLHPELLFLDIEMPGLNGFEVLRSISPSAPLPLVIFVTGYDQHAIAAFEANALAYLLKPVDPQRLGVAVDRARRLNESADEKESEQESMRQAMVAPPKALRQIVCRRADRVLLIPVEQVLWFYVDSGIVRAKTASDSFSVNYQLTELEAALPPDLFFRARREILVNLTAIREIRPYFRGSFLLIMSDAASTEIALSERRVRPFRDRLPGL
jgi:two-component system LytT family response regulator